MENFSWKIKKLGSVILYKVCMESTLAGKITNIRQNSNMLAISKDDKLIRLGSPQNSRILLSFQNIKSVIQNELLGE